MEKFLDLVESARQECRIQDIHVIVQVSFLDGALEHLAGAHAHFGDSMQSISMLARTLLDVKRDFDEIIASALSGGA
jgi:hypothetical protein